MMFCRVLVSFNPHQLKTAKEQAGRWIRFFYVNTVDFISCSPVTENPINVIILSLLNDETQVLGDLPLYLTG